MSFGPTRTPAMVCLTLLSLALLPSVSIGQRLGTDSAGIEIVEAVLRPATSASAFELASRPRYEIGTQSGAAYELFGAVSAVHLRNGILVVANTRSEELRFYDGTGSHIRTIGGRGAGPGEFSSLRRVFRVPGDTLVALAGAQRVSMFTGEGAVIRAATFSIPMGRFSNQTWLSEIKRPLSSTTDKIGAVVGQDTLRLVRFSASGVAEDTLLTLSAGDSYFYRETAPGRVNSYAFAYPFGRRTSTAVDGNRFHVIDGNQYEIRTYDPTGQLTRILRLQVPLRRVTAEHLRRNRDELRGQAPPGAGQMWEQVVAGLPTPQWMPAFRRVEIDAAGRMWAEEYRAPEQPDARWFVFEPNGRLLGSVAVPATIEVMTIGRAELVARTTDANEVERVQVYAIHPSGPQR